MPLHGEPLRRAGREPGAVGDRLLAQTQMRRRRHRLGAGLPALAGEDVEDGVGAAQTSLERLRAGPLDGLDAVLVRGDEQGDHLPVAARRAGQPRLDPGHRRRQRQHLERRVRHRSRTHGDTMAHCARRRACDRAPERSARGRRSSDRDRRRGRARPPSRRPAGSRSSWRARGAGPGGRPPSPRRCSGCGQSSRGRSSTPPRAPLSLGPMAQQWHAVVEALERPLRRDQRRALLLEHLEDRPILHLGMSRRGGVGERALARATAFSSS